MKKIFSGWVLPVIIAVILALLIKHFLFFNIKVPSRSMYPTIKAGDRIIVTRVFNKDKLKRGDIVVFHSNELGEDLIKRLIGVPGDTVEVNTDGSVLVNSNKIDEPYVVYNLVQNDTNRIKNSSFKVPKDSYLFLGDNRADSLDSRYWENCYINKDQIKGKGRIVIFPFSRIGKLK